MVLAGERGERGRDLVKVGTHICDVAPASFLSLWPA